MQFRIHLNLYKENIHQERCQSLRNRRFGTLLRQEDDQTRPIEHWIVCLQDRKWLERCHCIHFILFIIQNQDSLILNDEKIEMDVYLQCSHQMIDQTFHNEKFVSNWSRE